MGAVRSWRSTYRIERVPRYQEHVKSYERLTAGARQYKLHCYTTLAPLLQEIADICLDVE